MSPLSIPGSPGIPNRECLRRADSAPTTIAVSENKYLTKIAKRTLLSDNALSILIPIMEDVLGWSPLRIRMYMEQQGFNLQEWEKVQTDTVTIVEAA